MKNKATWIVVGIVFAIILLIGGLFISSNNKAIFLEEQINAAQADINVAEKRRYDLVFNLVDAVQSYQDYEGETMESIVSARNSMEHGDVEGAQIEITAVAEAYPELKANENYKQLMNELALTENQIAQYRNNYNEQVRSYNKMVRSFPNNIILNILGYKVQYQKASHIEPPRLSRIQTSSIMEWTPILGMPLYTVKYHPMSL